MVYETMDGGSLPARVVVHIDATDQYLVQLAPQPDHWWREVLEREPTAGYIVFKAASLSLWHTNAAPL